MSSIASTTTLQVSTLAALMHWQPRTLREVFRQLTGLRLKDVLLLWRIRQAKELIASGSASVDEAARCYGWRSRHGLDVSCRRYGQESASRLHARVVNAPVQAVREQLAETIRKKKLRK